MLIDTKTSNPFDEARHFVETGNDSRAGSGNLALPVAAGHAIASVNTTGFDGSRQCSTTLISLLTD